MKKLKTQAYSYGNWDSEFWVYLGFTVQDLEFKYIRIDLLVRGLLWH
jgi:hypothetical protein